MLNNLTLEELISLKLELSMKTVNKPLYGFELWNNLVEICRESIMRFAYTNATSEYKAAQLLNLPRKAFTKNLWIYQIPQYFNKYKKIIEKQKEEKETIKY